MGLESHVKQVLKSKGIDRGMYRTYYAQTKYRLSFDSHYLRNKAYRILRDSGEFNPVKVGQKVIGFRPLKIRV